MEEYNTSMSVKHYDDIQELRKEHDKDIVELTGTLSSLTNSVNDVSNSIVMEVSELASTMRTLEAKHDNDIKVVSDRLNVEINSITNQLNNVSNGIVMEVSELASSVKDLQDSLTSLIKKHDEDIEAVYARIEL